MLINFLELKYLGSNCHICRNSDSSWFTRYIYIYIKYTVKKRFEKKAKQKLV